LGFRLLLTDTYYPNVITMKSQLLTLSILTLLTFPKTNFAQRPNLGTVASFTLYTKTGAVTNTGISEINGKIGTNAGPIAGFVPKPGQQEIGNSVTAQAFADLQIAYDEIYSRSPTFPTHGPLLGNGETLIPGVYLITEAATIEGELTLDANGNSNAIFIIKVQGALSPGPGSKIILADGALSCNVYWAVEGGAVTIATLSEMKGTFMANPGALTMNSTSILEGRLLSLAGAIEIDASIAGFSTCSVLPVSLVDFKAKKNITTVELSWKVGNEFSMSGYELERSADGNTFFKIATITPGINPETTYRYTDQTPLSSTNYYRLRMHDQRGLFKYSNILKISMTGKTGFSIYPNPVSDHRIFLQLDAQTKGEQSVIIFNRNGQKLMSTKFVKGSQAEVRSIQLDKTLPPGIYLMQVRGTAMNVESVKFIVN
jgi:hypothetical protein